MLSDEVTDNSGELWFVRCKVLFSDGTMETGFEFDKTEASSFEKPSGTKWFVANAGRFGFFRVHYDDEMLKNIEDNLKNVKSGEEFDIPALDRAGTVDDLFTFGKISYNGVTPVRALQFIHNFAK